MEEIFNPVVKIQPLEINSYDLLIRQKVAKVEKYKAIEKTEKNYKVLKDAKNDLVKERTSVDKLVKADCKIMDDVKLIIKAKGAELNEYTVPLEKELAEFTDAIDNAEKKKEQDARERQDVILLTINNFKQDTMSKINKLQKSDQGTETDIPEIDFTEFPAMKDLLDKVTDELIKLDSEKKADLKAKEDFAIAQKKLADDQAELARQKAEIAKATEIVIDKGKVGGDKTVETTFVKQDGKITITDVKVIEPVDNLPELDDDLESAVNELDALLTDTEIVFDPTLQEIVSTLKMRYPVIVSDPYFIHLEKIAK